MQHGFQRASLAPDGFAVDAVQVVADQRLLLGDSVHAATIAAITDHLDIVGPNITQGVSACHG